MQASAVLITVIVTTIGESCREDARRGVNAPSTPPTGGTANDSFILPSSLDCVPPSTDRRFCETEAVFRWA